MPRDIGVEDLQELLASSKAQIVEVLPAAEYKEEHLPGALNIPLKELGPERVASLDRRRPLVVYCWDDA